MSKVTVAIHNILFFTLYYQNALFVYHVSATEYNGQFISYPAVLAFTIAFGQDFTYVSFLEDYI